MMKLAKLSSPALALVLSVNAGFAVTPEEVWENWKLGASGGATMTTTSETRNGAVLEIRGVEITASNPESGGTVRATFESLTLTDRGDGTVQVGLPPVYRYEFSEAAAQADKPTLAIEVSQPAGDVIASGTADAVRYDYNIPEITAKLTEAHDTEGVAQGVQATATLSDARGHYQLSPHENSGFTLDAKADFGPLKLNFSGKEPGTENSYNITASLAGFSSGMTGTLLPPEQMGNLSAAVAAGFRADITTKFGALVLDLDGTESGNPVKGSAKLDTSEIGFLINDTRIVYGLSLMGGAFQMDVPAKSVTEAGITFTEASQWAELPVGVSLEARDFSYLLRLTDLTLSENFWAQFDPSQTFARDPATLIIDVSAKGAWLWDVFNTAQPDPSHGGDMPARLDQLTLTQALVKFVGASADANGALTFDNNDLETFEGFPAPTGKITVNLSGISVLLDKLVALGFVSPEDLTGVRMGMAMFARPGTGPDQLVTEIEFRDKGLFINGQRLM